MGMKLEKKTRSRFDYHESNRPAMQISTCRGFPASQKLYSDGQRSLKLIAYNGCAKRPSPVTE